MLNTKLLFLEEDFLHYYWQSKKLVGKNLVLTDGSLLEISNFGFINHHAGPDFFNAQISINGQKWAGNIEMHLRSSDWLRHKHQEDAAYNNVILHVVFDHDDKNNLVKTQSGNTLPTLALRSWIEESELENYLQLKSSTKILPCEDFLHLTHPLDRMSMLERCTVERLEQKAKVLVSEYEQDADWQGVAYRLWLKCFGLKINQEAFEQLGRALPFKILQKHIDNPLQIEALLLGTAGFLNLKTEEDHTTSLLWEYRFLAHKYGLSPMRLETWKFHRLRPASFPTLRLAQLAALLPQLPQLWNHMLEAEQPEQVYQWLNTHPHEFWLTHYTLNKKSKSSKKNLSQEFKNLFIINGIIPLLFAYGQIFGQEKASHKALRWLELAEAEKNTLVNRYAKKGFELRNALDSQGILQLNKEYCKTKKCLQCSIGQKVLKS